MRTFKFRAWDGEKEKMFAVARYDLADNTVYSHLFACDGYLGERLNIMQFTGLKDKNGVEIYEGDVGWDEHSECYGVVEFDEGKFVYVWESICEDLFETDIEIIGNIYENSELI